MHVFLSPHFDDAVLSCGATIHQLVQRGERVTVITIMGQNPYPDHIPDTPIVRDLHTRWQSGDDPVSLRIREDEAAICHLGATPVVMTRWPDCIYRVSAAGQPVYPSEESLFGMIHPDDPAARDLQTATIPDLGTTPTLYAPLGAGNHVDHQIVRDWALRLIKINAALALKLYEEYPYTINNQAVQRALAYYKSHKPPLSLRLYRFEVDEPNVVAKIQAIARYESQISTFWANLDAMEAETRQHMVYAGAGRPAERFWEYP
ncbi:MAG: PIG-L family deacetylase [Anaerolineaceae bacterium]|nr:PIG-L family deacetylase [Anaerolineaceae bacterium]